MGGVYNGDPSIRDNSNHGADFSMDGPLFAIGEIAYQPNSLPGDRGLIGNYKAGFWYDNSPSATSTPANLNAETGDSTPCLIKCLLGSESKEVIVVLVLPALS